MKNKHDWIMDLLTQHAEGAEKKNLTKSKELILAVRDSNLSDSMKIYFSIMLMDQSSDRYEIENLKARLATSYQDIEIEEYLNKLFFFNPKLGIVEVQAGLSGRDENDESSRISERVTYSGDVDELFKNADKVIHDMKKVIRAILVDAKRMWVKNE